ncbi:MAG: DUF5060 domain-containing protein [Candidatus Sumerlaeia bacterium]|nr:DUF5060 domain-containing protein [Candidatus Sumerlaeia bacterium]
MSRASLARTVFFLVLAARVLAAPSPPVEFQPKSAQMTLAAPAPVKATPNTARLMPHQVFELTFQYDGQYKNPTWDVTIDVEFVTPGGRQFTVGGFFYGSSKPQKPVIREIKDDKGRPRQLAVWPCLPADLWKARLAPWELGSWKYTYTFRDVRGMEARGSGTFEVVKGRVASKGPIRFSPANPFRFIYEDGTPFWPIGFQDGVHDNNHNGSAMDSCAMEGPFRPDPEGARPKPPAGAMFARGPLPPPQNADVDFGRHARAGFNLWRFSPNNFSIKVFAPPDNAEASSLDHVRWEQAIMVDELLQMTHKYGLANFYGLFGYHPVFAMDPKNEAGMAKVKRLIKYSVDRWGAYVDFWEFLNEQKASDEWYAIVIPYLKSLDPYRRPISTSWERPELDGIEINAPHWYGNEDELQSDQVTVSRATAAKKFGKPVIFGEQGNSRGREDRTAEGIGGVWDPGSARRMRVRNWTAMFHEVAFIFWETSYAKDGHYMNLWIGPEERQYVRAMQDFARRLDGGVKMVKVELSGPEAGGVRAYGLRSDRCAAVYLHHFRCAECAKLPAAQDKPVRHTWDHDRGEVKGLQVAVDVPRAVGGYWYRPTDGAILARFDASAGLQTLTAPPFREDLALLLTGGPAPDADGDGIPNDADEDDDNDGVPDAKDAFPLEREEWADADGDRIGDNMDMDVDGNGIADDRNDNGKPDNDELDWDGDGVPVSGSIPWDAFPHDPKEWRDTDGDGIGDNADPDDDGDGWSDEEERRAGTNPLDPVSFP